MIRNADRPVRIGVQLAPQHVSYEALRSAVSEVEDMGVDVLFNWDHFFPLTGDPDGKHFECWTMLAAWAEQTTRIEFGALVSSNSYRNPDLIADMARTVDHISAKGGEGRLVFGIGAGWFERDYDDYGYEFGTAGSRLKELAQAMPKIETRWELTNPSPTRKIPVLIGGGGEKKTLRIVATHADIWHSFSNVETLQHKVGVLQEHCDVVGRDINEIEISTGVRPHGSDGKAPIDTWNQQYDLGARLFTLGIDGPDLDLSGVTALLEWRDKKNA